MHRVPKCTGDPTGGNGASFPPFPLLLAFPKSRFVIYKLPKNCDDESAVSDRSVLSKGLNYKYMDATSTGWQDGVGTIKEPPGALALTLAPLYKNNRNQVRGCRAAMVVEFMVPNWVKT